MGNTTSSTSAPSHGRAGSHRSPRPARSARQRRRATDQRLAKRAAQLGFASLLVSHALSVQVGERVGAVERERGEGRGARLSLGIAAGEGGAGSLQR